MAPSKRLTPKRPHVTGESDGLSFVWQLSVINGNAWARDAMPLLIASSRVQLSVPRSKWAFYLLYPVHLFGLLVCRPT